MSRGAIKNAAAVQESSGEQLKSFWCRFLLLLGLYLDDLLMVAAGVCFTASAAIAFGLAAALAVAGICLLGYGIVVAQSRGGGDGK